MFNFTPEERRVTLFVLSLALAGLVLNNLIKANAQISAVVYPPVKLAKLNLNQAGLSQFKQSKCVPEKTARQIIEYRDFHQRFESWEEVRQIKGIGEKRLSKLQELFFIE